MSNTKKIVLMSTLVLLLAVTAICNFVLAGTQTQTWRQIISRPIGPTAIRRAAKNLCSLTV